MIILKTENVDRIFNSGKAKVHALKDISIEVEKGTLTMLKGRSGSGKTTLMNILGALDKPTNGKVFLDGEEVSRFTEARRDRIRRKKVGFIFQSVALLSNMSAYENVEFGMRICGYPEKGRKERAEEVLTLVGLGKRMHHRPQELSGGEQQRVAIARALAHKPSVIFADEPTAALDSAMALRVMQMFQNLVRDEGITFVMTTHDPNMMELADHVYTLEDGEIIDRR